MTEFHHPPLAMAADLTPQVHSDTLGNQAVVTDLEALGAEIIYSEAKAVIRQSDEVLQASGQYSLELSSRRSAISEAADDDWALDEPAAAGVGPLAPEYAPERIKDMEWDVINTRRSARISLRIAREAMQEMVEHKSDDVRMRVESELRKSVPPFLEAQYRHRQETDPSISLIDWLTEQPPEVRSGQPVLGTNTMIEDQRPLDGRFRNFLQAHNHRLHNKQARPEFVHTVEATKRSWLHGISRAVKQGWLDPHAVEQAARVGEVRVYEGDYFSTYLRDRAGYYRYGRDEVVVGNTYFSDQRRILMHELNHALIQNWDDDEYDFLLESWLYEPLTEEIAIAINSNSSLESVYGENSTSEGFYVAQRNLLNDFLYFCAYAGIDLNKRDLTRIYSSDSQGRRAAVASIREKFVARGYEDIHDLGAVTDEYEKALGQMEGEEAALPRVRREALAAERAAMVVRSWMQQISDESRVPTGV